MVKALLFLAMAVYVAAVTAQNVSQPPNVLANVVTAQAKTLAPFSLSFAPLISCGMTSLIQTGDTCASITTAFGFNETGLLALNPGLDCKNVASLTSICVGGIGASCNKKLDANGQCPDVNANVPLVPATAGSITLSEDLRIALTGQPDLYAILEDSQTLASLITVNGTTGLVMTLPGITPTITAIQGNPGHPFILLWSAGGAGTPLVISIVPNWFTANGGMIAYVPGSILTPSGNRKLLARTYPTGSCSYAQPYYYG